MITNFLNLLQNIGLNISEDNPASGMILFLSVIIFFALMTLLCIFNLGIYWIIFHYSNNEKFLIYISNLKYHNIILKFINIYKRTRIGFIISEILMCLFCLCSIIWFCVKFIVGLTV